MFGYCRSGVYMGILWCDRCQMLWTKNQVEERLTLEKKNSNVCCTEKTILQNIKNCTTYCYISHLVRALRLVSLAGRNSLYGPLNSNVCMTWKLSPLVEARDKVTILLILFFLDPHCELLILIFSRSGPHHTVRTLNSGSKQAWYRYELLVSMWCFLNF